METFMFGAILGDIIGEPYEFDRGDKSKKFPLFRKNLHFTDDTVMTIAGSMAEAFYGISEQFKMWAYELTTEDMH